MNKPSFNLILFFFTNLIFTTYIFSEDVVINAESIFYDKKNAKVYAEQNVRVKYKDVFLETESLVYDLELNKIYTSTDSFLNYHTNRLFAKSLQYDVNSESFLISDFYGYYDPYYCYSSTCSGKKEEQVLTNAKVTHCGLKKPHYWFKSKSVVVRPNDKIKLYSPALVIRSVPVIWIPYYEVSLKPRKDYIILDPSYENERGIMLKAKYGREIYDGADIAIITDSSYKHLGLGSEFKYKFERHNGILYFYSVKEFDKNKTRWNLRINNTHTLGRKWSAKTNVEFISDEQLYHLYEKENWFFVRRELNSSLSLSRDTQKYTFRISYLRNDKYDDVEDKFVNNYYRVPIDFVMQPFSFKQVKISENIKLVPTFIESTTYYDITSENNLSVMYPFRVIPEVTLSPSTLLKTVFETNSVVQQTKFYNIYYFAFPVRFIVSRYGSFDFSYNYGIRSLDNSLEVSTNVVSNNLSLRNDFYYKKLYARFSTTYDFLLQNINNWYERFQPIILTAGVSYKNVGINTNISYLVPEGIIRSFQVGTEYVFYNNSISINYSRDNYKPDQHFLSPSVNIYIPENLQVRFRSALNITREKIEILNNTLELYKDLHCWEAKLFCNVRKSVVSDLYIYELGGFISLKFKPYVGSGGKISEVDKRYFPWRE